MFLKRIILFCLSIAFILTAGCNQAVYNQTENNIADAKLRVADVKMHQRDFTASPALVMNNGMYVDKTPINISREPSWLKNNIVLRGDQLPFSYYSRTIASGGGRSILTHYQTGLNDSAMVSINYSGSVKGALDLLASKTGNVYNVSGNNVYWQAFITRTYDIAFMPGSSDYMMGRAKGSGGTGQSGGGGGGAAGTTTIGTIDDSASAQYSNLKATLSLWKDLESSIQQMLSPDGKVMVSEATTSVTVRDRPSNVNIISKFITNLNSNLSKQVLVKIEILEVKLENDFNFGINWNVVQHAFNNGNYQLVSNNGSPISITSITGLNGNLSSLGINNLPVAAGATTESGSAVSGVLTLINALNQQGKVSVVTEPQVLCQNNQVSEIRIVEQRGYLASVQTTSFGGNSGSTSVNNGNSVTSQITPGSVTTGFTLYVLPKILRNKVYLQVNADISNNLGIQTITSNGATITPGVAPPANTSIIQVPNIEQKQFNQRSVVASGDTLILAGFKEVGNSTGAQQLLTSQALGGKAAQQTSTETVILITPIVLRGIA